MSQGFRTIGLFFLTLVLVTVVPQVASATETADLTFVEAFYRDAYLEIAGVWGLEIVFDPKFRGGRDRFTMEMPGVTALEALNRLALAGHHAIVVDDSGDLLVMDDTPQNRRTYEPLEIATIAPKFISAEDLSKMLRSLIEARRITFDENLHTVTLRDTRNKICIARQLMEIFDQAPAEIDLDVRVFHSEGRNVGAVPNRLTEDEFRKFTSRSGSSLLASFGMTLVGSRQSVMEIPAPSGLLGRFSLTVTGKTHKGTDEATLDYRFDWSRRHESGVSKLTERFQYSRQTARLSQGEALVLPLKIESPETALILTIGPKIIRPSEFDPEAMEPLRVGTESELSCRDLSPLEEALRGAEVKRDPVPIIRPNEPPRVMAPGSGGAAPMGWYDGRPVRVTPDSPEEKEDVEDPEDESGGSETPPPN